ncbi:hypothetical protein DFH11DRAFT_1624073 [Phellopilus nigrolimitatus]|nr:hypothetical protein DFH11DRAFT_1624073 [Phellopilus nigrolimitatus]
MTRTPDKTLTRRQSESLQVLMKALTDFVLEDKHEDEDISDYDDQEVSPRKTPERGIDEGILQHHMKAVDPKGSRIQERLVNHCKTLINETVRLEYSLRTIGSGGSGMYGAWKLRQSLRGLLLVLENVDLDDLLRTGSSDLSERYALGLYIDRLPAVLHELSRAFFELETFLLDFISEFHSVNLNHALRTLMRILSVRQVYTLIEEYPKLSP